ncbi:MAG: hypothetical protein COB16_03015 [Rhodobacteraceae bacterium]|nr:MAG: hypothetical protein COB16_03015 [Paracoccaceae bacterium]
MDQPDFLNKPDAILPFRPIRYPIAPVHHDVMFEYGRSLGDKDNDALRLALNLFESAAKSPPFYVQRKAELMILMAPPDAEIILRGRGIWNQTVGSSDYLRKRCSDKQTTPIL